MVKSLISEHEAMHEQVTSLGIPTPIELEVIWLMVSMTQHYGMTQYDSALCHQMADSQHDSATIAPFP